LTVLFLLLLYIVYLKFKIILYQTASSSCDGTVSCWFGCPIGEDG